MGPSFMPMGVSVGATILETDSASTHAEPEQTPRAGWRSHPQGYTNSGEHQRCRPGTSPAAPAAPPPAAGSTLWPPGLGGQPTAGAWAPGPLSRLRTQRCVEEADTRVLAEWAYLHPSGTGSLLGEARGEGGGAHRKEARGALWGTMSPVPDGGGAHPVCPLCDHSLSFVSAVPM